MHKYEIIFMFPSGYNLTAYAVAKDVDGAIRRARRTENVPNNIPTQTRRTSE